MGSRAAKPGKTLGLGPPEGQPWVWMTNAMFGSITFRALGINARRILDFLLYEHGSHGGRENGNLAATYRQLETWGVGAKDVRRGLEELYVTGFVELTLQGQRQAGGGDPSRYALTWLPTFVGTADAMPPSHAWRHVIAILSKDGVNNVVAARAWLRSETADKKRGHQAKRKRRATPHLAVVSPPKREAS